MSFNLRSSQHLENNASITLSHLWTVFIGSFVLQITYIIQRTMSLEKTCCWVFFFSIIFQCWSHTSPLLCSCSKTSQRWITDSDNIAPPPPLLFFKFGWPATLSHCFQFSKTQTCQVSLHFTNTSSHSACCSKMTGLFLLFSFKALRWLFTTVFRWVVV